MRYTKENYSCLQNIKDISYENLWCFLVNRYSFKYNYKTWISSPKTQNHFNHYNTNIHSKNYYVYEDRNKDRKNVEEIRHLRNFFLVFF